VRIFLDANILFSAAKSDGAIRYLIGRLLAAGHSCWADEYVVAEARRNLSLKFAEALGDFEALLRKLKTAHARAPAAVQWPSLDWLPEKDRPVLLAAVRLRCDALLTGDRRHFGAGYGKVFNGVAVHSPRSLAEALDLG
jgi:hypothetical protein